MPRKKKGKCPICQNGNGKYFAVVLEFGNPTLKEMECPIDGKKKVAASVQVAPVQTSLVGEVG